VHRLPLQDEKGNVCGLVSQTDVLRFFVAHLNELLGTDLRSSSALPTIEALGLVRPSFALSLCLRVVANAPIDSLDEDRAPDRDGLH
jgi:hypothetical protein